MKKRGAPKKRLPEHQRATLVSRLVEHICATFAGEGRPRLDTLLALKGDADAARRVMEVFVESWRQGAIGTRDVSDTSMMVCMARLVERMLRQPEPAFRAALGYSRVKQAPDERRLQRVLYQAVLWTWAEYGAAITEGHTRIPDDRCAPTKPHEEVFELVADAIDVLHARKEVFPAALSVSAIKQHFKRQAEADPAGPGFKNS
jgi:hypothetical protein